MRRVAAVLLVLGLTASAFANAAMGLGLEMFDPTYWMIYVATMVGCEAWLIGRFLGMTWFRSIGVSVFANAITGVCCGYGGICAPILHQPFVGGGFNPQPFWNAIVLLFIYAVPSAFFEIVIWRIFYRLHDISDWKLLWRSILVHLGTVPLALVILLIPAQPYKGGLGLLNGEIFEQRRALALSLGEYVNKKHEFPAATTLDGLIDELAKSDAKLEPDKLRKAFGVREISRFGVSYKAGLWTHTMVRGLSRRKVKKDEETSVVVLEPTQYDKVGKSLFLYLPDGNAYWQEDLGN